MFEQERLRGDGAYAIGAEQLCAGDNQVNGEDEDFAHRANGTIIAGTFKTARRRRIGSHYEFASHSIVIYRIDPLIGRLTYVGHEPIQGKTPRSFGIDPTGSFLLAADQDSDSVLTFRIDVASGKLQPTGHGTQVPTPVCVKFLTIR
jgi:hypothetical protein